MKKRKPAQGNTKDGRSLSPEVAAACGSLKGKYAVVLDDGRTTIYISDRSKEAEIVERYKHRLKR